jgi:hypothetical protein
MDHRCARRLRQGRRRRYPAQADRTPHRRRPPAAGGADQQLRPRHQQHRYALLLFNPKRSEDDLDSKVWRYVGSVRTGEDNSAACDDGNVMPCTDSDGELAFVADGNGLPRLTVTFKGTTIEAPARPARWVPATPCTTASTARPSSTSRPDFTAHAGYLLTDMFLTHG